MAVNGRRGRDGRGDPRAFAFTREIRSTGLSSVRFGRGGFASALVSTSRTSPFAWVPWTDVFHFVAALDGRLRFRASSSLPRRSTWNVMWVWGSVSTLAPGGQRPLADLRRSLLKASACPAVAGECGQSRSRCKISPEAAWMLLVDMVIAKGWGVLAVCRSRVPALARYAACGLVAHGRDPAGWRGRCPTRGSTVMLDRSVF